MSEEKKIIEEKELNEVSGGRVDVLSSAAPLPDHSMLNGKSPDEFKKLAAPDKLPAHEKRLAGKENLSNPSKHDIWWGRSGGK